MSLTHLKDKENCVSLEIFHSVMSDPLKLAVTVNYVAFKEGNFISNVLILIMKPIF